EWCDNTFNPWIGCTKVDELCAHCYAETRDKRHLIEKVDHWGKGAPRLRTSAANWRLPLKWNSTKICEKCKTALRLNVLSCSCGGVTTTGPEVTFTFRRPRVFCASLADWLDDEVPIEWLADLLALIHATPNLDWLLLTKRPENWMSRLVKAMKHNEDAGGALELHTWILDWVKRKSIGAATTNVWIGTSVGTQKSADLRIPQLLQIPAKIRFLSCEPLLGPVRLIGATETLPYEFAATGMGWSDSNVQYERLAEPGIHWLICGGESGAHARPMHPDWARSLRDQCAAAGVPFFFKQWGEFAPSCAQYPQNESEHWEAERAGNYGDIALEPD